MGKIFDNCSTLIMDAMKKGDKIQKNAYTNMKAALLKYKTSPEGSKIVAENGGNIPDEQEIKIINKMVKELRDAADGYAKNGRVDISEEYNKEASFLEPFLPKMASEEEIRVVFEDWLSQRSEFTKKDMKEAMAHIKSSLKNCDGKIVSKIIMSYF